LVIRAYECEGKPTNCTVNLFGKSFEGSFEPRQVKTFIVGDTVKESDFLE